MVHVFPIGFIAPSISCFVVLVFGDRMPSLLRTVVDLLVESLVEMVPDVLETDKPTGRSAAIVAVLLLTQEAVAVTVDMFVKRV